MKAQKNQSRKLAEKEKQEAVESQESEPEPAAEIEKDEVVPEVDESDSEVDEKKGVTTKLDRMFNKKNQSVVWSHYEKIKSRDAEEDDEDLLTLARQDHDLDNVPTAAPGFYENPLSVRDKRNQKIKNRTKRAGLSQGTKVIFDDEGNAKLAWQLETEKEFLADGDDIYSKHAKYVDAMRGVMNEADQEDKVTQKQKLREKKLQKKLKQKGAQGKDVDVPIAVLGAPESDEEADNGSGDEGNYESFGEEDFEIDLNESDSEIVPAKSINKRKNTDTDSGSSKKVKIASQPLMELENAEELALKLLNADK